MSSWVDSSAGESRSARSRSPRRDGGHGGDSDRNRDSYGRDREHGWERDRRDRSRSPGYDDGRKRRRSMSPYDRERYESRPRFEEHDTYRGHDRPRSPPRSRGHRHGGSHSYRQPPPDPHTFDAPATLKQYADWFRFYYPPQAVEEDHADRQAEQEAGDGTRPRNGIKSRWERYKKDFLQKQLQILFEHHKKSPWFAERYDPRLADLRFRVRKVGWRGRIGQFVLDLEDGKFDTPNASETEGLETREDVVTDSVADAVDTSVRNDDDFSMGPDGEDDTAGTQESKGDANGSGPKESTNEMSIMPEGNQVMIRTIPPDIGRVKLEEKLKDMSGFVYLALGDPMQKRNYYRAGWIKFDIATDVQSHIATLSERKIEGFKLPLTHNSDAFTAKIRVTAEGASRPDRIAKDLANAKRLAALLEEQYEQVRVSKPKAPAKASESSTTDAATEESPDKADVEAEGDVLAKDAAAEDDAPMELGSQAIERRLSTLSLGFPDPTDDKATKALEVKKDTIALDLYLVYLRSAFHTCFYCVAVCDHQEELQRKCIKHMRKPLSVPKVKDSEKESKGDDMDEPHAEDEGPTEGDVKKQRDGSKSKSKEIEARKSGRSPYLARLERETDEIPDERWAEILDAKLALLLNKEGIDLRDYGGRRHEDALAKAIEPHIKQEDEGKYRCKTCQKLFKATSFVEKHVLNKHPELVQTSMDDLSYFNNFALDPQRISPLSHYPTPAGTGTLLPAQAYGLQTMPSPPVDMRNGMNMGMGMGMPGVQPMPFYPIPGQFAFPNGDPTMLQYYPQTAVPQPMPMRTDMSMSGTGRKLGERIGGFRADVDGKGTSVSHGIEGLPAKPSMSLDSALSAGSGGGRRNGGGRAMPPPPPNAKEDPRAVAGRKVSYHDMDLVAEGDVELSY